MLFDLVRKAVVAGLEAQDKAIDFLDELVKKGKIDEAEREKFINELDKKLGETKEKSEEVVNEIVDKIALKNPFVCKKDYDSLQARVIELEKKLSSLTQAGEGTQAAE
ncbi:MAG: hypothetical protein HZA78_04400 [Candidatus Schekmanbacteria bacterium]|nr:hypothetical protein [Candidatus Schekmanbacteria bacterium]